MFALSLVSHADTVCQSVLRTTTQVYGKVGNSIPCALKNPWTDRKLSLHGWLRRGPLPHAKFHQHTITSFLSPKYAKLRVEWLGYFLVLPSAYSQDHPAPIFTINTSNDVVSRKDVRKTILSRKQNFTFRPHFPPKTQIFGQFTTGQNFASKRP